MKHEDFLTYKVGEQYKLIPRKEYNQLVVILHNKEFVSLRKDIEVIIKEYPTKHIPTKTRIEIQKTIKSFLCKHTIPQTWTTPLFNIIIGLYKIDFPISNSISLYVGGNEITGRTEDVLWVNNTKTGEPLEPLTIRLDISSEASTEEIIRFVRENQRMISGWQKELKFPKYKSPGWKHIELAEEIIRLRDVEEKTFEQISEQMSTNTNLRQSDCDYLADKDHVKNLYFTFKKRIPGL